MENSVQLAVSPDDRFVWLRMGRGRSLGFFATDSDVAQWLSSGLHPEYAPYFLVGADGKKVDKNYQDIVFVFGVEQFPSVIGPDRCQFWIWSPIITPELSFPCAADTILPPGDVGAACSLSGLIHVYHGSQRSDGARRASCIGLVERVENIGTGETREYTLSRSVYLRLKRCIKRSLRYATIQTLPDGSECTSAYESMTEDAARQHNEGKIHFTNRPGPLISELRKKRGDGKTT